jgi:DNA-binding SARP family transcriptional activator/tetratricopeptide (TPR) repeat protein
VQFRVLGPVEIETHDGRVLTPPRRRERCLLAVLLLEPGRVVPTHRLLDLLWQDAPAGPTRRALYGYVARVRGVLAAAGADGHGVTLVSHGDGYLLRVEPDLVDAHQFRRLLDQAKRTTDLSRRDTLLHDALALWRGPALHNATTDRLRERLCTELDELRLHAIEESMATGLALGRHPDLVPELAQLTAAHPLRSRLVRLHMLALHHSGRIADALDAYAQARTHLAEELGLDPDPELQRLQEAILRDETVPTSDIIAVPARAAGAVPAQLPADVSAFVGRKVDLKTLDDLVDSGQPTAVVISAIAGTAGVGKTALAVRWAHRVADRFPDGQLYVDLRGYDPDQPLAAGDVLARFLRDLGVAGTDIPSEVSEREARYRTLMAGRRMLVVLDNASTVESVRPLLPGTPSCLVVVTSRDSLAGLVARHGAHRIDLDLLPLADAVSLLRALIGGRVDAETDAATTLAAQCARLPLALRVAAELAATRPDTPLTQLVAELADLQQRLDLLDAAGDPRSCVRAVFSWSYQHLPAAAQQAFRLLGLHPGADFDSYAAASITNATLRSAQQLIDTLTRAYLIGSTSAGRYGMHDLLRAYAIELAADENDEPERRAALSRLLDHYLATSAAAMETLHPAERHRRPEIPPVDTPVPSLADTTSALAWLDAERANLVAACSYAATHGWQDHTIRLAAVLYRYLETGSHYPDALAVHAHAVHAAHDTGNPAAEGHALVNLGAADYQQGRFRQAAERFEQAIALSRRAGERSAEARALSNLALAHYQQGRYPQAVHLAQHAHALCCEIGDRFGEAATLDYLGEIHKCQGRYRHAVNYHRQALAVFRKIGHRIGEGIAMDNLADAYQRQGRLQQAADHHHRALTILRENGERVGEAYALTRLADVYLRQGHHQRAADHHHQAVAIFREIGNRGGEAKALNGLGRSLSASGQPSKARAHHTTALAVAADTGDRAEEAHAHNALAEIHYTTGQHDQANRHWQRALTIYTDLGSPETDTVRARLTTPERTDQRPEDFPHPNPDHIST